MYRNQIISSLLCHVRILNFILSAWDATGRIYAEKWLGLVYDLQDHALIYREQIEEEAQRQRGHCRNLSEMWGRTVDLGTIGEVESKGLINIVS